LGERVAWPESCRARCIHAGDYGLHSTGSRRSGVPTAGRNPCACPPWQGPVSFYADGENRSVGRWFFCCRPISKCVACSHLAAKHGYALRTQDRSFWASARTSSQTAMGHGYPVAGWLSHSSGNDKCCAPHRWRLVFASITLALCLPSCCLA